VMQGTRAFEEGYPMQAGCRQLHLALGNPAEPHRMSGLQTEAKSTVSWRGRLPPAAAAAEGAAPPQPPPSQPASQPPPALLAYGARCAFSRFGE
jgi:hypothetical protein